MLFLLILLSAIVSRASVVLQTNLDRGRELNGLGLGAVFYSTQDKDDLLCIHRLAKISRNEFFNTVLIHNKKKKKIRGEQVFRELGFSELDRNEERDESEARRIARKRDKGKDQKVSKEQEASREQYVAKEHDVAKQRNTAEEEEQNVRKEQDESKDQGVSKVRNQAEEQGTANEHTAEQDDEFDWESKGVLSLPARDQGALGTCASFAVVANVEAGRVLRGDGVLEMLSPEQIVECSAEANEVKDEADCGVFGGWPEIAFKYVLKSGLATEKVWPYCAGTINAKTKMPGCFPCMPVNYSRSVCEDHDDDFYCDPKTTNGLGKGWCQAASSSALKPANIIKVKISEFTILNQNPDSFNEDSLRDALKKHGPLVVALSGDVLQLYRRGIIDAPNWLCPRTGRPNHVALLVGYGFEKESNKPYWRFLNSWGPDFGEYGFFRLFRGKNICGLGTFPIATSVGQVKSFVVD